MMPPQPTEGCRKNRSVHLNKELGELAPTGGDKGQQLPPGGRRFAPTVLNISHHHY